MSKKKIQIDIKAEDLKKKLNIKDGKNYILTDNDKRDIAQAIEVPTQEIIREVPIVTNEVVEVAVSDSPEEIRNKLEVLNDDERLKIEAIKDLREELDNLKKNGGEHFVSTSNRGLYQLLDVDVSGVEIGNTIVWDGTTWIPGTSGGLTNPVDVLEFNTSYTQTGTEPVGSMNWNPTEQTVDLKTEGNTYQLGQELSLLYKNQSGVSISDGTPVMFAGSVGASGRIKIQKAIADGTLAPEYIIGIATEDIANGDDGKVTSFGKINNIDTTGTAYGETWADGDILYVSPTTAGYLTKTKPQAPNLQITVASVVKAHAVNGTLFVRPTWTSKMVDLSDVNGTPLTTSGQIPVWNQSTSYFDFTENITNYAKKSGTLTAGSVLFADSLGQITQDNSNLFWDDTNNRFYVGTNTGTAKFNLNLPSVSVGGNTVANLTANTWTNSSLVNKVINGTLAINQTGTAGFDVLDFAITTGTVGSGEKNLMRFIVNGSTRYGIDYLGQQIGVLGSVSTPTYSFVGDTNTGMYSASADQLQFATGGTLRFSIYSGAVESAAQVRALGTTASTPAFVGSNDTNTGIFAPGSDVLGFATGGLERMRIDSIGRIGIGNSSPTFIFDLRSTNTNQFKVAYSATQYTTRNVFSTGYVIDSVVGTNPQWDLQLGISYRISVTSSSTTFYSPTGEIYFNNDDVGLYMSNQVWTSSEYGLYSQNGSETLASFDYFTGYYYFNRALYGNESVIVSNAQFKIASGLGFQLQVGPDLDNLFQIDVDGSGNVNFNANSIYITPRFAFNSPVEMGSLPTSDPGIYGALWVDSSDGYTVKQSQG